MCNTAKKKLLHKVMVMRCQVF